VTPWIDAGKATAAFEKSVEGKDPVVAEAARAKFTQSLEQNERARQNADAPSLGRLEATLYRGHGLDRLSPDYVALSPKGQAEVEKIANAERRASRSAAAEERRIQADIDRDALADYGAIPTTADKAALTDEQIRARYPNATKRARDTIQGLRNAALVQKQKDGGIGSDQRKDVILTELAPLGYTKDQMNRVVDRVEAKLASRYSKEKPPTNEDVLREVADQVLVGTTVDSFMWFDTEEARWQAEASGAGEKWKPLPNDKQPGPVQNIIRKATAPVAASSPTPAAAPAPVAGGPKVGDQVGGATLGRPKTEVWEYFQSPEGKLKLRRVK
jgi:hypothetical protein